MASSTDSCSGAGCCGGWAREEGRGEQRACDGDAGGRLGEVAAIETTMAAAAQKLEAMHERAAKPCTVHLGMPDFRRTPTEAAPNPKPHLDQRGRNS